MKCSPSPSVLGEVFPLSFNVKLPLLGSYGICSFFCYCNYDLTLQLKIYLSVGVELFQGREQHIDIYAILAPNIALGTYIFNTCVLDK